MYTLYPYFTNDGSVGLFSPEADDIYHSTYGALSEAYEKFIIPAGIKDFLKENSEIKVLDICYGIGYNTKSLINEIINFHYNDTIYTNKINGDKYNEKLYTDNKKLKVFINAIDIDKNLAYLSPFFITNAKNIKNNKIEFYQEKINRMLAKKVKPNFILHKAIDIILLKNLFEGIDLEVESILQDKKYSLYFDKYIRSLFQSYKANRYKTNLLTSLSSFLHNIYYRHLSSSYKMAVNILKLLDFNFKINIDDARRVIKNDKNLYNFIFLDAFTPTKCPCLWTIDFFKQLYEHLEPEGMILTYSNSAQVRNAFLHAGFKVGKIYSESAKKFTGTVAIKRPPLDGGPKSLISRGGNIQELSEYDLGLMKTKAGIFYRDENLTLSNEEITIAHKIEVENSKLISSSKFIKSYKQKNKVIGM